MKPIPFNKPFMTGRELAYMQDAVDSGKISGNGTYTRRCQHFFEETYGFKKCLLTTSCTDALEMCALLSGVGPGDEVIVPSYTFVSSALAFVRQGAKIVFADSCPDNPNIDLTKLEPLVSPKTRVLVVVHYAGVACDMDKVMEFAGRHGLLVVEDAAQAIDSRYKGRPLGGIGHLAAFSFHETKNVITGEGGMLVVNDGRFVHRAEILWEREPTGLNSSVERSTSTDGSTRVRLFCLPNLTLRSCGPSWNAWTGSRTNGSCCGRLIVTACQRWRRAAVSGCRIFLNTPPTMRICSTWCAAASKNVRH